LDVATTVEVATKEVDGILAKMAAAVLVVAIIMIPRAILNDVSEGIDDHVPVFPVLLRLTFVGLQKQGWAGGFAGLSRGAKFSPAALWSLLFVRRKLPMRFLVGVAIGRPPTLPFLVWEPTRLFHDVVQFHFIKSGTPISSLTITPPELHDLFRALQYVCVAVFVARNVHKEIGGNAGMCEFTLLVILINSLHVEMHSNHMFWILPTSAISLTQYRYRLSSLASSALGR
jgi:hypothetical protein